MTESLALSFTTLALHEPRPELRPRLLGFINELVAEALKRDPRAQDEGRLAQRVAELAIGEPGHLRRVFVNVAAMTTPADQEHDLPATLRLADFLYHRATHDDTIQMLAVLSGIAETA